MAVKPKVLAAGPALIRAATAVTEEYERISSELGLTMQQARLLFILHRQPTNMLGLGSALRLTKSTMTGVVARMEAAGLVVRVPDEADRRNFVVTPTERGAQVAEEFERLLRTEVRRMLAVLEPAERDTLAVLLTAVIAGHED
ncbi:MarR family winged helix-turn-helix transcriptional regulator [Kribbella sp. NPDC004536]|uniref:MarR family winged helix-turn-helix transcriptional regulator n=1 Tax=Kribbella sp. NPDC004536 TaxID=3364106 RepID=UPI0036BD00F1